MIFFINYVMKDVEKTKRFISKTHIMDEVI